MFLPEGALLEQGAMAGTDLLVPWCDTIKIQQKNDKYMWSGNWGFCLVLLYTLLFDVTSLFPIQNLFSEAFTDLEHEMKCLFLWDLYVRCADS